MIYIITKYIENDSPLLVPEATIVRESLQPVYVQEAVGLLEASGDLSASRAAAILACGLGIPRTLLCRQCGYEVPIGPERCNHRLCRACGLARRRKSFSRLVDSFDGFDNLRFLTLSFRNVPELSKEYFLSCQQAFVKLRKRLSRVDRRSGEKCTAVSRLGYSFGAYVNVLEVKYHAAGESKIDSATKRPIPDVYYEYDQWNVHFHVLYDGHYIPQPLVKDLFGAVTGWESDYAHIEACRDTHPVRFRRSALYYVLGYLGKLDNHGCDSFVTAEFVRSTKGIRFYNTGGAARTAPKQKPPCPCCGSSSWSIETTHQELLSDDQVASVAAVPLLDFEQRVRDALDAGYHSFTELQAHLLVDVDLLEAALARMVQRGDAFISRPGEWRAL